MMDTTDLAAVYVAYGSARGKLTSDRCFTWGARRGAVM
jgi:hypothetical protein